MKKNIHFVGIGGIGISSLARYFLSEGFSVSGSDASLPEDLKKEEMILFSSHSEKNIPINTDLLIYSNAVLPDNPEILEAKKRDILIESYPVSLGNLTKKYNTIAISGTHGKSTTTAMLSLIMIEAGLDPTVIIGTKLKEFDNKNFRKGNSKYLVIEADEFKAAFLNYYPKIAAITNIEEDHLDFYKDTNDVISTFKKYVVNNIGENTLITNDDDSNSKELISTAKGRTVTYSLKNEKPLLNIPGKHNLSNALAATCISREIGINEKIIKKALLNFKGTWRRFDEEKVVFKNNCEGIIINDYAHHPTEIEATMDAVKEKYPERKIIIVFQPHQYQRTYQLFSKFKKSLSLFSDNHLLITDIYTVRGRESEDILKKVSAKKLADEVSGAVYTGTLKETEKYLLKYLQGNEIVVIMGAGDVYELGGYITKRSITN